MRTPGFALLVRDIVYSARRDRKLVLLPLCFVILVLTGILIFMTISGPLAPFIYPLF